MKNKIVTILLLAFFSSCVVAQKAERKFPIVIEFVSYCCGVPNNTPIIEYVKSFREKYKTKGISAYKIGPVGKEGEYYLAFPLQELTTSQMKTFVEEIQKIKVTPKDQGGIIYQKDFTIDSSRLTIPIITKDNLIKI